jgi:hypothetical protein
VAAAQDHCDAPREHPDADTAQPGRPVAPAGTGAAGRFRWRRTRPARTTSRGSTRSYANPATRGRSLHPSRHRLPPPDHARADRIVTGCGLAVTSPPGAAR